MPVVTPAEVKKQLAVESSATDAEVARAIAAAEAAIEEKCGPLTRRTVTSRVRCGRDALVLPVTPVLSLTSVTSVPGGSTVPTTGLYVTGGVVQGDGISPGLYDVTYDAGRDTVPADLRAGVVELVRHNWRKFRAAGNRPGANAPDTVPGAAYLFPIFVEQLIGPHLQTA